MFVRGYNQEPQGNHDNALIDEGVVVHKESDACPEPVEACPEFIEGG